MSQAQAPVLDREWHVSDFVLETHGLTKRYGELVAVDNLTMRVRRGEVYGFLGPNGAGKTTTLRMLLGLVRPTSGRATVLDARPGSSSALRRTVLLSSHLMAEVEQICDRVGVLSRGTLVREGTVEELRGRDHGLWVRAEPLQQAAELLEALPEVQGVVAVDGALRITAAPHAAPAINRALVAAGLAVWELRPQRASLEEVFLQLTRQPKEQP